MDEVIYDIEAMRRDIDSIDSKLMKLFQERMEKVVSIAEYKKKNGIPILNENREEEVIKKNLTLIKETSLEVYVEGFLKELMKLSREYQQEILNSKESTAPLKILERNSKIGFYGEQGSYSQQAMNEYFGDNISGVNAKEFEDVFIMLQENKIAYGVVPIENSSTGAISDVYDLLNEYQFYITGEICLKINHNLMAVEGTTLESIEEVYSHPQPFEQCRDFLKLHPNWRLIPYYSTSKSAEFVKNKNSIKMAVIASSKAAELYNLKIIKSGIHSIKSNTTKFAIIGKKMVLEDSFDKISIVFMTQHKTGSLFNVMRHFAEKNINLQKIESRPIKDKNWEYLFYLDFDGNLKDERVQAALELAKANCLYLKILGNYKKYDN